MTATGFVLDDAKGFGEVAQHCRADIWTGESVLADGSLFTPRSDLSTREVPPTPFGVASRVEPFPPAIPTPSTSSSDVARDAWFVTDPDSATGDVAGGKSPGRHLKGRISTGLGTGGPDLLSLFRIG